MPYSAGVFSLTYDWVTEQASPPIEISKLKTQETDIATGLSNCILRDGTGLPTASIPFNSQKITSLGSATLVGDAANAGQVQNGSLFSMGAVAGTNTITGTLALAPSAWVSGFIFSFMPAGANTGATTVNPNSLGAKSIVKGNAVALVANDLLSTVRAFCMYDGTNVQLLNPQATFPLLTNTGTIASQAANNVSITGGSITGITDITVADGGTGASTAANARTNLGVTATGADTTYCFRANNLSDVTASTARSNLGLAAVAASGSASDLGSGTLPNARLNNVGTMTGVTIQSDPGGTPSGSFGQLFLYY